VCPQVAENPRLALIMLSREAPERGSSGRSALGHVEGTAVACAAARQARTPHDLDFFGGRDRRRSGDLALFRRALYQLSYPTLATGRPKEYRSTAFLGEPRWRT